MTFSAIGNGLLIHYKLTETVTSKPCSRLCYDYHWLKQLPNNDEMIRAKIYGIFTHEREIGTFEYFLRFYDSYKYTQELLIPTPNPTKVSVEPPIDNVKMTFKGYVIESEV